MHTDRKADRMVLGALCDEEERGGTGESLAQPTTACSLAERTAAPLGFGSARDRQRLLDISRGSGTDGNGAIG